MGFIDFLPLVVNYDHFWAFVAGFDLNGNKVIAGNPGPGVNPITFSDDDRL